MNAKGLIVACVASPLMLCLAGCGGIGGLDPAPNEALAGAIREAAAEGTADGSGDTAAVVDTWGSLSGVFRYDGPAPRVGVVSTGGKDPEACGKEGPIPDESLLVDPESGGIKNVVIYVVSKKVPVHPSYEALATETVVIDNKNCFFQPHILPFTVTQTFSVHNSDSVTHNSNVAPLGDKRFNPTIPANGSASCQFKRSQNEPTLMVCNMHSWMKGYILPRDNPYFAVTDERGEFRIENLPAGIELTFQVWHESQAGYLEAGPNARRGKFKLTLDEGENQLAEVVLGPAAFQ